MHFLHTLFAIVYQIFTSKHVLIVFHSFEKRQKICIYPYIKIMYSLKVLNKRNSKK